MQEAAHSGLDRIDRSEFGLWDGYWHLLCHRTELPEASHFIRFEIFDREVVAFHDGNEVVVFDNRCPHRGTRIFDGRFGRQRFVCPYHGWSFAKGRLFIPERESFGIDPRDANLARYHTSWLGDFLFVSRRAEVSLALQLEGVADTIEGIAGSIAGRIDLNAYDYGCDWKIAVENALDQYHVSTIHAESLNRLKLEPAVDRYFGLNNISTAAIGDSGVEKKLRRLKRLFDIPFQSEGYIAIHLFPFTFVTSTFGYSYSIQQFYPSLEPNRTHFTSRFYPSRLANAATADSMRSFFDSSIAVNHQVFAEDNAVCSRVPADSWSSAPPRYLSQGEEKIAHFRRVMSARLGESLAGNRS